MKNIQKRILVTGGCGFIGSCFITKQIKKQHFIVNLDKMTYAANNNNLNEVANSDNYVFFKGGIVGALVRLFNYSLLNHHKFFECRGNATTCSRNRTL